VTATTSTKTLDTLTAELWDFLGVGADLDLPQLDRVELRRSVHDAGWECTAYTQHKDAGAAIEAVHAYAGGTVEMHTPYAQGSQPSGWQMSLWTRIKVAEVPIKVLAIIDADAYAEAMAADRQEVRVVGESVHILNGALRISHMMQFTQSGRDTGHAVCGAADGRITHDDNEVSCPDCLEGADEQYDDARQVVTPVDSTYSDPAVRTAVHASITAGEVLRNGTYA
jgi:hypothetical protein